MQRGAIVVTEPAGMICYATPGSNSSTCVWVGPYNKLWGQQDSFGVDLCIVSCAGRLAWTCAL